MLEWFPNQNKGIATKEMIAHRKTWLRTLFKAERFEKICHSPSQHVLLPEPGDVPGGIENDDR
jgi:hypothetical protein